MNRKLKKIVLLFIFGFFVFRINNFCQQSENLLDTQINLNLSKSDLLFVMQTLAFDYKIPVGVELDSTYRQGRFKKMYFEKTQLKFDDKMEIKEGTLKDILNAVIKQEPQYTWEIIDGVVNIYPVENRDYFLKELLHIEINGISQKDFDKSNLIDIVSSSDKFKNLLLENNVELLKNDALNQVYKYENTQIGYFSIKKTTVRGVFNYFVKNSNQKIWILERTGESKEQLSINF